MASPPTTPTQKDTEVQATWDAIIRSRFDLQQTQESETVASLDLELEALRSSLSLATRLRNSRNPACRLPVEVLSTIFASAQTDWHPQCQATGNTRAQKKDPNLIRYTAGWMGVSRVCSQWRQTALASSSLWCKVHCLALHPDSAAEMLSRSNRLKLSLVLDGFYRPAYSLDRASEDALSVWLCRSILRRTRQLVLQRLPGELLERCYPYICTYMPLLEDLSVSVLRDHSGSEEPDQDMSVYLPHHLLSTRCPPQFHKIHLVGRRVPWSSPLLSKTLTHLSMHCVHGDIEDEFMNPPMSQLLGVIASLPKLEELRMSNIIANVDHGTDLQTVPLPPSFKNLDFCTDADGYVGDFGVFKFLDIPQTASVRVVPIGFRDGDRVDMAFALAEVFRFSPDGDIPIELHLSQYEIDARPITKDPLPFYIPSVDKEYSKYPHKYRDAQGTRHFQSCPINPAVTSYAPILPFLPSTRRLRIASDFVGDIQDPERWIDLLGPAEDVRCVLLRIFDAFQFLNALCETKDEPGSTFVLFPRLETLALLDGGGAGASAAEIKGLALALLEVVRVRQAGECPLKEMLVNETLRSGEIAHVWRQLQGMVKLSFFV
ncbi:hypothetical protein PENSPDRAFT_691966 [Peniophora sp. CONT]|nr:hypothetical protein PENSPDRAFT_691966 [Peniophora sp. CONT]